MADLESTYPEIFALARRYRAAGATVRLLCIHDAEGNLVAGKLPPDMPEPGPILPLREADTTPKPRQRYNPRRRPCD